MPSVWNKEWIEKIEKRITFRGVVQLVTQRPAKAYMRDHVLVRVQSPLPPGNSLVVKLTVWDRRSSVRF